MITIATRYNLDEALLLRSHLEGSGISAFIPDEYMAQNEWSAITAIGGIRVQVSPDDAEMARQVLNETYPSPPADSPPLHCPHCQSSSVSPHDLGRRIALVSVLIFCVPLPFFRDRYQCADCGEKFRKMKSSPS